MRKSGCTLILQVDDAYLGGGRNGEKTWVRSRDKPSFIAAVRTDHELDHPTVAAIESRLSFDDAPVHDWVRRRLASDVHSRSSK